VRERLGVKLLHLFPGARLKATIVPLPTLAGRPSNGGQSQSASSVVPLRS